MKTIQLDKLSDLLIFTKETLRQLEQDNDRLDFNIKYWLKKGKIIALKKGLYLLKERWEKETNKDGYLEYIANQLYQPSYLSGEYVMSKYGLLTEAVFGITGMTTKTTKVFTNVLSSFNYYSVSPRLFLGYEVKKTDAFPIAMAKKSKAVFDFLYLRFIKNTPVNEKTVAELRINWENMTGKEFRELISYGKKTKSVRLNQVINLITDAYAA
jgi:predicted transcriptional regulator of viral defense system